MCDCVVSRSASARAPRTAGLASRDGQRQPGRSLQPALARQQLQEQLVREVAGSGDDGIAGIVSGGMVCAHVGGREGADVSGVPRIEHPSGSSGQSALACSSKTRSSGASSTLLISSSTTWRSSSRSAGRSSGWRTRSVSTSTASGRSSSSTCAWKLDASRPVHASRLPPRSSSARASSLRGAPFGALEHEVLEEVGDPHLRRRARDRSPHAPTRRRPRTARRAGAR